MKTQKYFKIMQGNYREGFWEALSGYESRYYHSWRHVKDMLTKLDIFSGIATRPDLIREAIFWHDAIYQTREIYGGYRPDRLNVEASANLFGKYELFGQNDANAIQRMIMGTADHLNEKRSIEFYDGFNQDLDLFIDLDLSSLAAPYPKFLKNNANIRIEFLWVTDDDFYRGQWNIMNNFIAAPNLFRRSETRAIWESSAMKNMQQYVAELNVRLGL